MSRRPMDGAHTNPFRQSIIARSESPFESGLTHFGNSSAPSLSSQSMSSNPFGERLPAEFDSEEELDLQDDVANESLPPSYTDVVPKGRARPEEKRRPSRDERQSPRDEPSAERRRRGDDEDRLERERRRLAEREKYYRERRKELERRASSRAERSERSERSERGERGERVERSERGERSERKRSERTASGNSSSRRKASPSTRSRSKSESVGGVKIDKYGRKVDKHGRPLDTIDRMDVTGLFGPGAFHHDGPFDACTPHRNKKTNPRGPVAAFDAQGPNNSLMPDNVSVTRIRQEDQVFGREGGESEPLTLDMAQKVAPVHGVRTMGLGSTTFLDGMPASKDAIQQAESDRPTRSLSRRLDERPQGLLGRVKSLRRPT